MYCIHEKLSWKFNVLQNIIIQSAFIVIYQENLWLLGNAIRHLCIMHVHARKSFVMTKCEAIDLTDEERISSLLIFTL